MGWQLPALVCVCCVIKGDNYTIFVIMTDLFKKLNTLMKAGLNDLLGDDLAVGAPRRKPITPERLGKDVDREIVALRQRVNEAVDYEGKLRQQVETLESEVARWDRQADDAVAAGSDAAARHAIDQMQRAEQRLNMARADLREHQLVTQELIQRVNTLEAVVADARRQQQAEAAEAAEAAPPAESERSPTKAIADVLSEARQTIASLGETIAAQERGGEVPREQSSPTETKPDAEAAEQPPARIRDLMPPGPASNEVEDDLERRRQRLSKK